LYKKLSLWDKDLILLEEYFRDESRQINKQKIVKKHYVNSKTFLAFTSEFRKIMFRMRDSLSNLKTGKR